MAVHRLDSEKYKLLVFDKPLWIGVDCTEITQLVGDLYPPITKVTSKAENQDFSWLYGKVARKGKGKIRVKYPYTTDWSVRPITLKNVSFATFPYVILEAKPEEGWKFEGWQVEEDLISGELLTLTEQDYTDVTSFYAIFKEE